MRAIILISILLHQLLLMGQIQNDINIDIRWDNDLIFMKDRYYTNGFDVFLSIDKSKQYKKNYFVKDESLDQEHHITTIGVSHKIYTPRAYGSSRIIRYDRPFAGALYGTMGGRKTHTPNESIYTELQFGILGPYTGAQPIQTEWHEFTNSDIPGSTLIFVHHNGLNSSLALKILAIRVRPPIMEQIQLWNTALHNGLVGGHIRQMSQKHRS